MKSYLKIALLLLVLGCLVFFVWGTDWTGVAAALQQVGFKFTVLLSITFLSAWLGMLGWRYCLPRSAGAVSNWQLFNIRQIGENIAIINPASMIGGEAAKIYMLTGLGVGQRAALHSIILSRAMMIGSQLFLLLLAGAWFFGRGLSGNVQPGAVWPYTALLFLPFAFMVLWRRVPFRKMIKFLLHRLGVLPQVSKLRLYIRELSGELRAFYRENRRGMLLSFLFSSLHWMVGALEFYFILRFLGIHTPVLSALLVDMGVVVFKSAGGFIPGQIGIEEYGNKFMLAAIGVTGGTIWVTASVLRRARQLCWLLWGVLSYFAWFRRGPAAVQS